MAATLQWMAAVVGSGDRGGRHGVDPGPVDQAELSSGYLSCLQNTVRVLAATDPDSPTWTFSSLGHRRAAWWARRLAVEIAIHRWDAQHALTCAGGPRPPPVDAAIAQAGIQEFVTEFLPDLLSGEGGEYLTGVLHLRASDARAEWWIDLNTAASVNPCPAADTDLRGSASDLLLWLTNRLAIDDLDVVRRSDVAEHWRQLTR
jgi:Mycothiol maleylpyruvate isomerase N-terminal domain/MDMPI C-terminal domain